MSSTSESARAQYSVIDAFTDKPYEGNPAAVVLLDSKRIEDAALLQKLAIEFNLQETAFLCDLSEGPSPRYRLRWFTPVQEFPLCGHATLASSHFLFQGHHPGGKEITFETMSGPLVARRTPEAGIELDFPADSTAVEEPSPDDLRDHRAPLPSVNEALAEAVLDVRIGKLAVVVEVQDNFDLANARLDATSLAHSHRYYIFTQVSRSEVFDICSRVLDGAEACPEDPVTGSAHCILAPYYLAEGGAARERLLKVHPELRRSLHCLQGGPRQGQLDVEWQPERDRVLLRGKAVTVMDGSVRI